MTVAEELKARGFGEHASAPLETILQSRRGVYLGIDPTADSLHVGHLVGLLLMRRLGNAGHRPVFLVGGGTGMIGDPRDSGERTLLDTRTILHNKRAIRSQLQKIMGRRIEMVDNASWLMKVSLIEFLRDIGKHFTVNELIKRDLIKRRIEDPNDSISFTEFSYSLLQGYDFLTLYRKKGVELQIGGSDQWTNLLSGVELIRRKLGEEAFCFTLPLVTDAQGKKFGKSEGNAVWLDPKKTTPFDFYQFWIRLPDQGLETYLKLYTFLPLEEITALMERHRQNPAAREAQRTLAREVTRTVHGEKSVQQAEQETEARFTGARDVADLKKHLKVHTVTKGNPEKIINLLFDLHLVGSRNQGRQAVQASGVSLGGTVVKDIHQTTQGLAAGDYELKFGNKSAIISIVEK